MAAPQQGQQGDNSYAVLWWIAIIFGALGFIWYVFKDYLITFYLSIKLYEVRLVSQLFSTDHFVVLQNSILNAMAKPEAVTFNDLLQLGAGIGDWLRYPLVILMIILAFLVYFGNATRVYKRSYNMQELAKLEKNNWPQITPVIHLNLIKTDIDKGPWAMAMTPMQFCKRHKLVEEVRVHRREAVSRKDRHQIDVVLKRGEANKVFALQLGQLWKGIDHAPPYVKALFAAFAARINADSKSAAALLERMAASSTSKLNFSGTNELLKKYIDTKPVKEIIQSHAYVFTVMASMLEGAREDGVQASADFLWLKPLDRRLWYTLNTVGRQTPFVEVAGIFAHWVAEKEAGRKLLVPMVEEATNALEIALKEVVYHPDEAEA